MMQAHILFIAVATLVGTGCKQKDAGTKTGEAKTGEAKTGEAKPTGGATKLPKLGLQIDVPGEVTVKKAIGRDEGHMLMGSDIGGMSITVASKPQTIEEAKSDAAMYSPKNLKEEKLADGWALSFENTGGAGTNYWVDVQREIGGKLYKCTTTGSAAAQSAAVLAACKTLKP